MPGEELSTIYENADDELKRKALAERPSYVKAIVNFLNSPEVEAYIKAMNLCIFLIKIL